MTPRVRWTTDPERGVRRLQIVFADDQPSI